MCLISSRVFFFFFFKKKKKIHIYKKGSFGVYKASFDRVNMLRNISTPLCTFTVSERTFNSNVHEELFDKIRISRKFFYSQRWNEMDTRFRASTKMSPMFLVSATFNVQIFLKSR